MTSFRAMSRLGSGNSADGEAFATKLENFCRAGTAKPSCGAEVTGHPVHFDNVLGMQKWLNCGYVDFAELFRGFGEATIRVREAGCTAAEGFDKHAITYNRCWCLEQKKDQRDCAWLIVYQLRPYVIHLGTPCTNMSQMGKKHIDEVCKLRTTSL